MEDLKFIATEDLLSEFVSRYDNIIILYKTAGKKVGTYNKKTFYKGDCYVNLGIIEMAREEIKDYICEDENGMVGND